MWGSIQVGHSDTPIKRRLFNLLESIIGEERGFQQNSPDFSDAAGGGFNSSKETVSVRDDLDLIHQAHDALCELHRKFIGEHELVIQRCFYISRQARAGLLSETEMDMEIERLRHELERIKKEHELVESECHEFLRVHREFLDGLQ